MATLSIPRGERTSGLVRCNADLETLAIAERPTVSPAGAWWPTACRSLAVSAACHGALVTALACWTVPLPGRSTERAAATVLFAHDLVSPTLWYAQDSANSAPPAATFLAPAPLLVAQGWDAALPEIELQPIKYASDAGSLGVAAAEHVGRMTNEDAAGSGEPGVGAASFFGATAGGDEFVFVVDMSGSMAGRRFRRARTELRRALEGLHPGQRYFLVFFNDTAWPMPEQELLAATEENLRTTHRWVNKAQCNGNTDPWPALALAVQAAPDAVFFLTDGKFDPQVVANLPPAGSERAVPIHTIGFENHAGEALLRAIADRTGGSYRFVK